jgi:hypothetical protein
VSIHPTHERHDELLGFPLILSNHESRAELYPILFPMQLDNGTAQVPTTSMPGTGGDIFNLGIGYEQWLQSEVTQETQTLLFEPILAVAARKEPVIAVPTPPALVDLSAQVMSSLFIYHF